MKQSEQARRESLLDSQRNEEKLVQGGRQDGHWPDGQHAPIKDQGFDRSHQGAPRADDRSSYPGQSAYGSLEAQGVSAVASKEPADTVVDHTGGLSRYGSSLGSQYSLDQEAGASQRTAAPPLSRPGSAAGAAPDSTDVGQYAGEYDDTPSKFKAEVVDPHASVLQPTANSTSREVEGGTQDANELRGDQQLKEEIHQRLVEHPDLDIHDLSVALRAGHATLEGSVPQAHMKEVIVELVDNVSGVLKIDDRITVRHVNAANHATAQAYAVGGQPGDDLQHSGPATFGAASAKASAMKQQQGEKKEQGSGEGAGKDAKS
jgi:osmotically-inducible protein OsmY